MEKRVLAAIALSIAVLMLFQYYEQKRLARVAPPAPGPAAPRTPPARPEAAPEAAAPAAPAATVPAGEDTVAAPVNLTVEGRLYRAVLDNRGALLTSWVLKEYKSAKGAPFEMIPTRRPEERWSPFGSLTFASPELTETANTLPYEVEIEGAEGQPQEIAAPATVVMRLRRGGLSVRKRYRFDGDNYLVELSVGCEKDGKALAGRLLVGQDIGPETEHFLNPAMQLSAVSNQAGKVRRDAPPKDPNEVKQIEGSIRWVGLDMLYFAVIAMPRQPLYAYEIQKVPVTSIGLEGRKVDRNLVRVTLPQSGDSDYLFYVGPKLQAALEAVPGADLSEVIDYGMFSILVRPLLAALIWIEGYVHNYGWAIIALTLVLTLALFPFRLKQVVSMKKMQVVQPKIKEIQEKYARYKRTDPRRAQMNQEIMAVYKEHKVNPLGGCLPLLLQMPLLFAFYRLLAASIELRQAPFIGWIQDLSAKDPYYILPIVMGVTMLVQQRMTTMAPGSDPTQAKVMMFMPVIFTVMFLNVSSGLNLYFLCSNIFTIAMQKVAERFIGDRRQRSRSRK